MRKNIPLPKGRLPRIFFGNSLSDVEVPRTESVSLDRLNRLRLEGDGGGDECCGCGSGEMCEVLGTPKAVESELLSPSK